MGPVRLVDITSSPDELRAARDNDTLAYIRRGETVNYNVSADKLKGGIPAERSNIRVRRPFWYSLNVPDPAAGRLVIPEHFDQRFVATALEQGEQAVVIDKLYVVEPFNADHQPVIAAALNSLLTWYQIELRGRTQLGEGVLEAKIPDLEGLLVLDPRGLSDPDAQRLAEAFGPWPRGGSLLPRRSLSERTASCSTARTLVSQAWMSARLREPGRFFLENSERRCRSDGPGHSLSPN